MKTTKKMKIITTLAAVAVAASVTVFAAYDSSKDPIVSLSYLTDIFKPAVEKNVKDALKPALKEELKKELKNDLKSEITAELKEKLETDIYNKLAEDYSVTIEALQKQIDALSNEYEVVSLSKGQTLRADSACEFVILSGSASVKCVAKGEGLIDCTDGVILFDGSEVPLNHKMLVPDNGDNRGFVAAGAVQVLVKGGCTVG